MGRRSGAGVDRLAARRTEVRRNAAGNDASGTTETRLWHGARAIARHHGGTRPGRATCRRNARFWLRRDPLVRPLPGGGNAELLRLPQPQDVAAELVQHEERRVHLETRAVADL